MKNFPSLRFIFLLLSLYLLPGCAEDPIFSYTSVSVIPKPSVIKNADGSLYVKKLQSIQYTEETKSVAQYAQNLLLHEFSIWLPLRPFSAETANDLSVFLQTAPAAEASMGEYELLVSQEGVHIQGADDAAVFYGLQTLRQLILSDFILIEAHIPHVQIKDAPRFPWRGMLLDCSRHFMEKDFVKRYIDLLAFHKMNVLHWHLTEDQGWRIEIDAFPKLTEIGAWRTEADGSKHGGFYTKDDIREIVAYAESRHVMVVPEIEMPGHSLAALAGYPQFSCTGGPHEVTPEWGVFKEIYCAGNDSTFHFLETVLDEVIELFPSPYIHIGGDEVPKFRWENCSKCQQRIRDEGLQDEHELQSWFLSRIGNYLAQHDKKMIGWDEILEGGLPEGAIVQSWRGFDGAVEAVKHGTGAILSPTSHAYFDYGLNAIDLEKVYTFNPVPEGLTPEQEALILGGECNMWSERAPQDLVDSKVFPRILAMAEVLWSDTNDRDFEEFSSRVFAHYKHLDRLDVDYGFSTEPVKLVPQVSGNDLSVELLAGEPKLVLRYTTDGTDPQLDSPAYETPLVISEKTNLSVRAFLRDKSSGEAFSRELVPHKLLGANTTLAHPYHKSYSAGGANGLTDGVLGTTAFRDGQWQGYWGTDFVATFELPEAKTTNLLSAGFLQYNNAWIFLPTEVIFEVSMDGEHYEVLARVSQNKSPREKGEFKVYFPAEVPETTLRYLRVTAKNLGKCPPWHDAAGSDAWIFVDEILMY